ncbi:MAG: cell wall-active antibiotics response protein [Bacteroidales bacterium]|jgi:predicted membrane protein|nr:cell wall-active antibiotics response protein [Bacteroidales bacterium]
METNVQKPKRDSDTSNRFIIGILLVIAGFILILEKTTVLPAPLDHFIDDIIFSWQMLLIVIGVITLAGSGNKTPGIVLIAVGGFFLIPELFSDYFRSFNFFWPALFIVIGVVLLINSRRLGDRLQYSTGSKADMIDYVNIFSGAERQLITENFMGGKVTSIFGGGEVDLTRSSLAPGNNIVEITCIFGGTTLIVPESWNVIIDVTPILGGFSDGRKIGSDVIRDTTRSLTVKGVVIFGGGELKCRK